MLSKVFSVRSVIIICLVCLIIPSLLSGADEWKNKYIIKDDGIYTCARGTDTLTPFILLGETGQNVVDKMGRPPDNYSTTARSISYVSYEDTLSSRMEPFGLIFYTFTYIIPPEFEYYTGIGPSKTVLDNLNVTIESIGIYDSRFRTVKGIGVGSTVKELYAAHGRTVIIWHYYDGIGWCLEYPAPKGRMFFSIGQVYIGVGWAQLQNGLADDCPLGAIYLTGTKLVRYGL
ncbi:MAG: hypothetical protein ABRQ38_08595 [Candidatus Eremiobacterota bacterium]